MIPWKKKAPLSRERRGLSKLDKVERSNVEHIFIVVDELLIVIVNFKVFSFWIHFFAHEYIGVKAARVADKVWI